MNSIVHMKWIMPSLTRRRELVHPFDRFNPQLTRHLRNLTVSRIHLPALDVRAIRMQRDEDLGAALARQVDHLADGAKTFLPRLVRINRWLRRHRGMQRRVSPSPFP